MYVLIVPKLFIQVRFGVHSGLIFSFGDMKVNSLLDAVLSHAGVTPGRQYSSLQLLQQAGFAGDATTAVFLMQVLIDDGYLRSVTHSKTDNIVTITPRGWRHIAAGGYVQKEGVDTHKLELEQIKLKSEVRNLRVGFWLSIGAFIISMIALIK